MASAINALSIPAEVINAPTRRNGSEYGSTKFKNLAMNAQPLNMTHSSHLSIGAGMLHPHKFKRRGRYWWKDDNASATGSISKAERVVRNKKKRLAERSRKRNRVR